MAVPVGILAAWLWIEPSGLEVISRTRDDSPVMTVREENVVTMKMFRNEGQKRGRGTGADEWVVLAAERSLQCPLWG